MGLPLERERSLHRTPQVRDLEPLTPGDVELRMHASRRSYRPGVGLASGPGSGMMGLRRTTNDSSPCVYRVRCGDPPLGCLLCNECVLLPAAGGTRPTHSEEGDA